MKLRARLIAAWVALTVLGCGWGAYGRAAEPLALSGRAMGTSWRVRVVPGPQPVLAATLERLVADELERLEQIFSTYRVDSEISRFNRSSGTDWQPVSPLLAEAAAEARRISELTRGAFDVTVGPLVNLWGFGPAGRGAAFPPAEAEVERTRARVDWRRLEARASPPAVRKTRADVEIDFSSLAKGLAADVVSQRLLGAGVPNHLVQIGGDVKTSGHAPDGGAWRTGIESPHAKGGGLAGRVALAGQALSTSGNYRNVINVGGRPLGHLIDPRTGRPAEGRLAAVSVIHDSCATSSALATGLFVQGSEEGYRIAEREGLACLFLLRDGDGLTLQATAAMRLRFVADSPP